MKHLLAAALCAFAPVAAMASSIGAFTDLVVFGDSYSDPGNAFFLTGGTIPDPALYPNGQFTNGDVWATKLGADFLSGTNFAVGNAKAATDGDVSPDLAAQIATFQAAAPALGPNPLAAIYLGSNDLREATSLEEAAVIIGGAVAAIADGITALIGGGITEFAVFGLPNLGRLPEALGTPIAEDATLASLAFNATLQSALDGFSGVASVRYVDLFGLFETVLDDPDAFGFTNTTDACLLVELDPTACAGDLGFFFHDPVHATDAVHSLIAETFVAAVVPLPASGILLVGGLGGLLLLGQVRSRARRRA